MTGFDPERFEEKYTHYFTELQQAYRNAFDRMQSEADSEVVHAIDQLVLAESDPQYTGDGTFEVVVPEDAVARVSEAVDGHDDVSETVERYRVILAEELAVVFGLGDGAGD